MKALILGLLLISMSGCGLNWAEFGRQESEVLRQTGQQMQEQAKQHQNEDMLFKQTHCTPDLMGGFYCQ